MGTYTGEQLRASQPVRYRAVVEMLASGMSYRAIERETGVVFRTLKAIQRLEGEEIAAQKQSLAQKLTDAAERGADSLIEDIERLPGKDRAIALGILIDKARDLRGEASQVIEIRRGAGAQIPADFDDFNDAIEGEFDLEPAESVSVGEDAGQKGGALPGGAASADCALGQGEYSPSDSAGSGVSTDLATGDQDQPGSDPAQIAEGGGGGARAAASPSLSTDQP